MEKSYVLTFDMFCEAFSVITNIPAVRDRKPEELRAERIRARNPGRITAELPEDDLHRKVIEYTDELDEEKERIAKCIPSIQAYKQFREVKV